MKKFIFALLLSVVPFMISTGVIAEEPSEISVSATEWEAEDVLSPGINVMSYSSPMIVSGCVGDSIELSCAVFEERLGYVPTSVRVLSLPDGDNGTLVNNSLQVSVGDTVSVISLSSFMYVPTTTESVEFDFSPDDRSVMRCVIKYRDGENTPPTCGDIGTVAAWTGLDTSVSGYLTGTDANGDGLTFEITAYPSLGLLKLKSNTSGKYVYEPYEGVSGTDSFKYRVCDSYGAYSNEYTVRVTIADKEIPVFADTEDSTYNAAYATAIDLGLMQTRSSADGEYFDPDCQVSRIDFLVMAMNTLGAKDVAGAESSVFSDDDTLSAAEKGYLNVAYELGIINGTSVGGVLTFEPDEGVTAYEAAVILNSILGLPEDDSITAAVLTDSVPAWAVPSVSALTGAGIYDRDTVSSGAELTRGEVAVILSGIYHRLG